MDPCYTETQQFDHWSYIPISLIDLPTTLLFWEFLLLFFIIINVCILSCKQNILWLAETEKSINKGYEVAHRLIENRFKD